MEQVYSNVVSYANESVTVNIIRKQSKMFFFFHLLHSLSPELSVKGLNWSLSQLSFCEGTVITG